MNQTYLNKKVLVIGLGKSGQSAAQLLARHSATVVGVDKNPELINQLNQKKNKHIQFLHEKEILDVLAFDLVVVSPGIPHQHPLYLKAQSSGIEIIGEVELSFRFIQNPCIAITGTNGKTTVTLLVTHVLNHSGKVAKALGNVGEPLTNNVDLAPHEIAVIELSSYQLETLKSPLIDAGVILNITPDHLDRYPSMHSYAAAKIAMKNCMKPAGELFINENIMQEFGYLFDGYPCKTMGFDPSCDLYCNLSQVFFKQRLAYLLPADDQGKNNHDIENQMAAFALCQKMGISAEDFLNALKTFKKPSHRIEFVCTIDGVSYYDDSKGTNLDAVLKAVHVMPGEVILIAGGVDKGAPYTPWIAGFQGKVKNICAIGQAAEKIQRDMGSALPVTILKNMREAVQFAKTIAKPGQCILLSPGCSSYDMYRDYAHRGEEFQQLVHKLL